MSTKEGHPSGRNPEWEIDRAQNVMIARMINVFLQNSAKNEKGLSEGRITLNNSDNKYRQIFLGVAYDKVAGSGEDGLTDILPVGFNFPVYFIKGRTVSIYDDSSQFNATTLYGVLPNEVIGVDGLIYLIDNINCLNLSGQGLRIEKMSLGGSLEDYNEGRHHRLAKKRLTRVDFVPREEHSRIMPLTLEDYQNVSKMFKQIDSGWYKY